MYLLPTEGPAALSLLDQIGRPEGGTPRGHPGTSRRTLLGRPRHHLAGLSGVALLVTLPHMLSSATFGEKQLSSIGGWGFFGPSTYSQKVVRIWADGGRKMSTTLFPPREGAEAASAGEPQEHAAVCRHLPPPDRRLHLLGRVRLRFLPSALASPQLRDHGQVGPLSLKRTKVQRLFLPDPDIGAGLPISLAPLASHSRCGAWGSRRTLCLAQGKGNKEPVCRGNVMTRWQWGGIQDSREERGCEGKPPAQVGNKAVTKRLLRRNHGGSDVESLGCSASHQCRPVITAEKV